MNEEESTHLAGESQMGKLIFVANKLNCDPKVLEGDAGAVQSEQQIADCITTRGALLDAVADWFDYPD